MKYRRFLKLRMVLLVLVLPLVFYYIFVQLHDGWDKLQHYRWSLNIYYLALSIFTVSLYAVVATLTWQWVLSYLGSRLGFWASFRIVQLSQLGKYLPGRVWAVGGQVYLGEQEGIARRTLIWATGLQWFFNLLSGATLFLPFLFIFASKKIAIVATLILLLALSLGLFFGHFLRFFSTWFDTCFNIKLPKDLSWLSPTEGLKIFLALTAAWFLFGLSFWALINAFIEIPLVSYYPVLASFCGAWVLGTLSFFTPAGMGVREGALVYLLGHFLLPPVAVMISIASRLWLTVVDLSCASIAWWGGRCFCFRIGDGR